MPTPAFAAPLRLTFLGGASGIGASCVLVEAAGARVLFDCGVATGGAGALPDLSPLQSRPLDAIVLTHAHLDHSGGLPALCDLFPAVPVWATPPTIEIATLLLRDALKVMSSADREGELPLYGAAQVERALHALVPAHVDAPLTLAGGARLTLLPASHILGAAMAFLETDAGSALVTGDYSVSAQQTVPALPRPALRPDVVVSEATYGTRLHEDRRAAEERLIAAVAEVAARGGQVLIPAFAVGRAQEVLLILKRAMRSGRLGRVPVFADGLVRSVCDVYARHPRYVSRALLHEQRASAHPFFGGDLARVEGPQQREQVLATRPCVIVASSGMLAGGASAFYARRLAQDGRNAILVTGYQDEESPGRALLDLAASGGSPEGAARGVVRIGGEPVEVACPVRAYGLSAHADRLELASFVEALRPRAVALVHGDRDARRSLASVLSCRDVVVPEDGQTLSRSFAGRAAGRPALAEARAAPQADLERARAVLGPAQKLAVPARRVAEAYFGGKVDAAQLGAFVSWLEREGLARRDDERPFLLWVQTPAEAFPAGEEARLEDELKRENPKGRLLELCMRERLPAPEVSFTIDGAFHVATMWVAAPRETISSGPRRAPSKKVAEQLAARAVLSQLAGAPEAAVADADPREAELKSANPKGKLLERCVAERRGAPAFESRAIAGGFAVRASLDGAQGDWFRARSLKTAEQAAAESLAARLSKSAPSSGVGSAGAPSAPQPGVEPRMLLNELQQVGELSDFGYRLVSQGGPPHQPIFVLVAWAELAEGGLVETRPVEAPSKKAGERAAAAELIARLAERGIR